MIAASNKIHNITLVMEAAIMMMKALEVLQPRIYDEVMDRVRK